MQAVTTEALEQNPELTKAFKAVFGADVPESVMWRVVAEWYYHDFVGVKLDEGQMWCVD